MQEALVMHSEQELIPVQFVSTLAVADAVRTTDANCSSEKVLNITVGEGNFDLTLNECYTMLSCFNN